MTQACAVSSPFWVMASAIGIWTKPLRGGRLRVLVGRLFYRDQHFFSAPVDNG